MDFAVTAQGKDYEAALDALDVALNDVEGGPNEDDVNIYWINVMHSAANFAEQMTDTTKDVHLSVSGCFSDDGHQGFSVTCTYRAR